MQIGESTIPREFLLAAAVKAAYRQSDKEQKPTRIEDISRNLFSLSQSGISLGEISLKRIPGGFYSEDVEILVGHFLDANFAVRRSPVQLTKEGEKVLDTIIHQEKKKNPAGVRKIEAVLGKLG
jgi:hypothetical protein